MLKNDEIDQENYLQCQQLINRVYYRAFESGCLVQELYKIMIGLSEHKFRSVTEFTNEITSTIFAEEADQKASSIFEYTNEEIIRLGLDIDTDKSLYLTKEEPPSE